MTSQEIDRSCICVIGLSMFHICFLLPMTFKLFGFTIFWLWVYLMQVIPESRHGHWIRNLRLYFYILPIRSSNCSDGVVFFLLFIFLLLIYYSTVSRTYSIIVHLKIGKIWNTTTSPSQMSWYSNHELLRLNLSFKKCLACWCERTLDKHQMFLYIIWPCYTCKAPRDLQVKLQI